MLFLDREFARQSLGEDSGDLMLYMASREQQEEQCMSVWRQGWKTCQNDVRPKCRESWNIGMQQKRKSMPIYGTHENVLEITHTFAFM